MCPGESGPNRTEVIDVKTTEIAKRRQAETKTGALGGGALVLISILEAFGVQVDGVWLKVVAGVVAVTPGFFSWLYKYGGLIGVIKGLLHGNVDRGARLTTSPAG
jgi:hypothetical protein